MMYRWLLIGLVSLTLVGCSFAVYRTNRDIAQLSQQIEARRLRGEFATWRDVVRATDRESRAIFQRYGLHPDVYYETFLMVRYQVAGALDRREITEEDGALHIRWADAVLVHMRAQDEAVRAQRSVDEILAYVALAHAVEDHHHYRR